MKIVSIPITLEETAALIRHADEGVTFSIPRGDLLVDVDGPVTKPMIRLAELRGVSFSTF